MPYEMKHVSPSQIETWLGCQRQWYWEYPMGIKAPPKTSALIGTSCHGLIEDVLLNQNAEDLSNKGDGKDAHRAIVRPCLPTLRPLAVWVAEGVGHVEREMKRPMRNGLVLKGRIDFISFHASTEPLVVDHKTTSSLQYAKTEEELRTNIQMLAYAYEATCSVKGPVTGVRVAHNVVLTRGAATARYTDALIPVREVHAGWTRIQDISDRMLETAKLPGPADATPNWTACGKFGGCAHQSRCAALKDASQPSPYAQEIPPMSVPSLPAHLLAKLGVKVVAPIAAEPVAAGPSRPLPAAISALLKPVAPVATKPTLLPPESPMNPRDAKVQGAQVAQVVVPPVVEVTATTVAKLGALGWSAEEIDALTDEAFAEAVRTNAQRDGVDLVLGTREHDGFTPIVSFAPRPPARRSRTATVEVEVAPVVEVEVAPVVEVEVAPVVEVEEAPKRRGRPPGSKNVVREEVAVVVEAPDTTDREQVRALSAQPAYDAGPHVAALTEERDEAREKCEELLQKLVNLERAYVKMQDEQDAGVPGAAAPFALYVDCLPEKSGVPYRLLDEVLAPFMALAAANYKNEKTKAAEPVSHYSLIPYHGGPAVVAAYALMNLDKVVLPGILYVDTRSPCAAAVLEILRAKADVIVSARGR